MRGGTGKKTGGDWLFCPPPWNDFRIPDSPPKKSGGDTSNPPPDPPKSGGGNSPPDPLKNGGGQVHSPPAMGGNTIYGKTLQEIAPGQERVLADQVLALEEQI